MTAGVDAVVVGAGLSGAACAWTLAQAGLSVLVLERAADVATGGASALPVGLMTPLPPHKQTAQAHLVQQGIVCTLQHCHALLRRGVDWQLCGSEQRYVKKQRRDTASFSVWHENAAWIKPAALVRAWLAHPRVSVQCDTQVLHVCPCATGWELHCTPNVVGAAPAASERVRTPRVILALGAHSPTWLATHAATASQHKHATSTAVAYTNTPLHTVGGHVLLGNWQQLTKHFPQTRNTKVVHAFNGMGHCIPAVPVDSGNNDNYTSGYFWLAGSTYEHEPLHAKKAMRENVARLAALLPECADVLTYAHHSGDLRGWHGVRCTSPTRLPVAREAAPSLYILTAVGSRGLSLAAICAQRLLACL